MRKTVLAIACLGLVAAVASAQPFPDPPVLQLYFSATAPAFGGAVPSEFAAQENPDISGLIGTQDVTLGLWAYTNLEYDPNDPLFGDVIWAAIQVNFLGPAISGGAMEPYYDPPPPPVSARWESDSDFNPTDGDINLIAVTTQGIGGANDILDYKAVYVDGGLNAHYWLGNVVIPMGSNTDLYMQVHEALFARGAYTTSLIHFGFGDDGVPGHIGGGVSSLADVIIPEPASLVLLALAGLALRRR